MTDRLCPDCGSTEQKRAARSATVYVEQPSGDVAHDDWLGFVCTDCGCLVALEPRGER